MLLQVMNTLTFCDKKLWTRRQWEKQKKKKGRGGKEGKTSGCNTKCVTTELVESRENVDDNVEFELKCYPLNCVATLETKTTKLTINLCEVTQRLTAKHARVSFNATQFVILIKEARDRFHQNFQEG